ncbi:MAG: alpha-L-fucosidase [bacterium]
MRITIFAFIFLAIACKRKEIPPPEAIMPVPTQTQLDWQEKELFAFVHFTINTFTDLEWGYGDEHPDQFQPENYDPDQIAEVFKEAGLKGVILTAKHHDGFCLWPSEYTEHSVKNSSWGDGKRDVVGEFKEACDRHDLEFGIYLSPWDRHHAEYATDAYVDYYQNQIRELIEKYGPIFEIWFDGANGGDGYYGGARETRKIGKDYYRWPETFEIVKSYNPNTIIRGSSSEVSNDSRWCGNEKGYAGETNWNMVTPDTFALLDQKESRELLNTGHESGTVWMPGEVDVSIRPGWFYHASEDSLVKSSDELFGIYLSSVGRGSPLLLNIPPDRRGMIHDADIESLMGWRKMIDESFSRNLVTEAKVSTDTYRGNSTRFAAANLIDNDKDSYWATDDGVLSGSIEIEFARPQKVQYVMLQEYVPLGQRIKSFNIEAFQENRWEKVAEATTIGLKRIIALDPVETEKLRINILDSRACPVISNMEIY